ncbi:Small ubiquitin-related modifier 1 [Micractinium conductrix]|uniref:Small ubiquitin-related modifier n=1 Tax=Micractinium conductrix TaxID=554055 RepID=A0A2P6VFB4_9CHLO|nr:Small ubiquitin-related modifier 1 [Micractinium conductrix]|eukprot:PSC72782.1 Small ubiquitin-related modifier 1 [Micractinium conductrix]
MEDSGENNIKKEAGGGEAMSIKVKDQSGGEVVFRVKPHTKFEKIILAFCQKKSVDPAQVRFVYDGNRLDRNSTPAELDMEEGDTIDAFLEQIGGCC